MLAGSSCTKAFCSVVRSVRIGLRLRGASAGGGRLVEHFVRHGPATYRSNPLDATVRWYDRFGAPDKPSGRSTRSTRYRRSRRASAPASPASSRCSHEGGYRHQPPSALSLARTAARKPSVSSTLATAITLQRTRTWTPASCPRKIAAPSPPGPAPLIPMTRGLSASRKGMLV